MGLKDTIIEVDHGQSISCIFQSYGDGRGSGRGKMLEELKPGVVANSVIETGEIFK